MSLGGGQGGSSGHALDTPDLDDIPDMEEDDLEEGDEATAAKPNVAASAAAGSRCVVILKLVGRHALI